jgi:hypothetical protein
MMRLLRRCLKHGGSDDGTKVISIDLSRGHTVPASDIDAVRRAKAPHVFLGPDDDNDLSVADEALVSRWPSQRGCVCDLLIVAVADVCALDHPQGVHILRVANASTLQSLLREAAADAQARMALLAHAVDVPKGSSVADLYGALELDANADGLAPRHAARVCLQCVLCAALHDEERAQSLAALVHRASMINSPPAISRVLELLKAAGVAGIALHVVSALYFSGLLSKRVLLTWSRAVSPKQREPIQSLIEHLSPTAAAVEAPTSAATAMAAATQGATAGRNGDGDGDEDHSQSGDCMPLRLRPLATLSETAWDPSSVSVALNAEIGPSRGAIVVLDDLVGPDERAELLQFLRGAADVGPSSQPPGDRWERRTSDYAPSGGGSLPPTWGLRRSLLRRLEHDPPRAVLEVQSRLCRLFPEYEISHMPELDGRAGGGSYSRTSFVANAAVTGNCFQWHVDADPSALPASGWLDEHGAYPNGCAGKPLFVSLLVYCDEVWRSEWDAETLFLETQSGTGFIVQPRPGRAVLMHQDVLHRVSCPSLLARRPRYSLVWKLIFSPRSPPSPSPPPAPGPPADADEKGGGLEEVPERPQTICRPEWGTPVRLVQVHER